MAEEIAEIKLPKPAVIRIGTEEKLEYLWGPGPKSRPAVRESRRLGRWSE